MSSVGRSTTPGKLGQQEFSLQPKQIQRRIQVMSEKTKEGGEYKDSLGQANPAQDLQKKTIEEVGKINEKVKKDAEKSAEPKGN